MRNTEKMAFQNPFEYKIIYIIELKDEYHKGLLKIGDATLKTELPIEKLKPNSSLLNEAARKRINEYANTIAVPYHLLHTEKIIMAM